MAQDVEGSIPSNRPKFARAARANLLDDRASVIPNIKENTGFDNDSSGAPAGLREAPGNGSLPPGWLTAFIPRRGLANAHLQTIVGNFLPRPAFRLASVAETVEVDPADGSRVLCHCHWQAEPERARRLTVVLVHGLEGSSESRYILGIAARAWKAGCNVVRMNMRTCGGTETLTPTLYHSGLSGDVGAVVRHYAGRYGLERVALAGYSMGGNMVLKLAGEWGNAVPLVAVATVCPAIDLAVGADALHEPLNRGYEVKFLRGLLARYRRKAKLFPAIYANPKAIGPVRSIRQFDDKILSRYWGFLNADVSKPDAVAALAVGHRKRGLAGMKMMHLCFEKRIRRRAEDIVRRTKPRLPPFLFRHAAA